MTDSWGYTCKNFNVNPPTEGFLRHLSDWTSLFNFHIAAPNQFLMVPVLINICNSTFFNFFTHFCLIMTSSSVISNFIFQPMPYDQDFIVKVTSAIGIFWNREVNLDAYRGILDKFEYTLSVFHVLLQLRQPPLKLPKTCFPNDISVIKIYLSCFKKCVTLKCNQKELIGSDEKD